MVTRKWAERLRRRDDAAYLRECRGERCSDVVRVEPSDQPTDAEQADYDEKNEGDRFDGGRLS